MSGNAWAALRAIRGVDGYIPHPTAGALVTRGLISHVGIGFSGPQPKPRNIWAITDLGRMVCDAFTEGKEQG